MAAISSARRSSREAEHPIQTGAASLAELSKDLGHAFVTLDEYANEIPRQNASNERSMMV
jgi:hypothetical protein